MTTLLGLITCCVPAFLFTQPIIFGIMIFSARSRTKISRKPMMAFLSPCFAFSRSCCSSSFANLRPRTTQKVAPAAPTIPSRGPSRELIKSYNWGCYLVKHYNSSIQIVYCSERSRKELPTHRLFFGISLR